jgi:RNA polymerase sigma-70 factor (ECF subfamily)
MRPASTDSRERLIRESTTPVGSPSTEKDSTSTPDDEGLVARHMAARKVGAALIILSPEERSVLIEVYYRGRLAADAAALLGIPETTVASRAYHALRVLRDAIGASPRRCP